MPTTVTRIAPILPVADLPAALDHYRALGFAVDAFDDESGTPVYGFAERDGIQLQLAPVPEVDPATTASAAYLYVADADALAAEWTPAPAGARTVAPVDTAYGLREGAHVDPWGNLLRFGSDL